MFRQTQFCRHMPWAEISSAETLIGYLHYRRLFEPLRIRPLLEAGYAVRRALDEGQHRVPAKRSDGRTRLVAFSFESLFVGSC